MNLEGRQVLDPAIQFRMGLQLSRRNFIKSVAATAALSRSSLRSALATATSDPEALQMFAYADVVLTGGPLKQQYDFIHAHYLALDNDRLLKVYRQRAGLPAPGKDMGGWYDFDGFVPGHSLGQYISGLARIGASIGDDRCHAKVRELIAGFAATLGPDNQSILRPKTNLWICYTIDKHFAGLIDSYQLSNVAESKSLLNRVLEGARQILPTEGRDRIGKKDPPYDETFVLPENLFTANQITGNPAFRELAQRYLLNHGFFDLLVANEDPFPGQHAYSHAIALSSGGAAYLTLGDAKYKQAMQHAFTLLTTQQQFASGGWGPNETFIEPHKGQLYDSLSSTVDHFETPCGSYAATKLARYLLRFTADPQYGDNLERVVYNTILAAKSPDSDGDYPYYSTYSPNAIKTYYHAKWPCCSGTLVQTVADYVLNLYFRSPDGVYVNMYSPSELRFARNSKPIKLVTETEYPASDVVNLHIETEKPAEFTVALRIPGWLKQNAQVKINGAPWKITPIPGTFSRINRQWHNHDSIELQLPQDFRTEAIDDMHPNTVALMRGPVQYIALNPPPEVTRQRMRLPGDLKPIAQQRAIFAGENLIFSPLYSVDGESYNTYFDVA
jgi:uncharacterized protein